MSAAGDNEHMRRLRNDATANYAYRLLYGRDMPSAWTEYQVRDGIAAISNGDPCTGCGASWRPMTAPNQRVMAHDDTCPYTEALERLGM